MTTSNIRSCARWVAVFCVSSLLALGAPPPAAADKGRSAPPGPAIEREPKVLTDEAEADGIAGKAAIARAANHLREAADLYGKAWEVYKLSNYICNQGVVLLEAGRHREAAESLYTCSKIPPSSNKDVNGKVDALLLKARSEICTLSVWTNVPRAEFVVDGHLVGTEPKREPIFIEVGEHTVMAKAARYTSGVTVVPCGKGDWVPVNLPLEPALKPGQVMSAPGPVQNAPILANVDREPLFKSSDFAPPAAAPRSTENKLLILAGGSFALAGTGLTIGSFLAAASKGAAADDAEAAIASQDPAKACNGPTPDFKCGELNANRDSATLFTALGVGASVLATGGIALTVYAIVDGAKKPGDPGVSMSVTPGFGSLAVTGRF